MCQASARGRVGIIGTRKAAAATVKGRDAGSAEVESSANGVLGTKIPGLSSQAEVEAAIRGTPSEPD